MKAVQQTLLDNQQVLLQSLHQNQTNIDRLGKLYFSYSPKVILLQLSLTLRPRTTGEQPFLEVFVFSFDFDNECTVIYSQILCLFHQE